MGKVLRSRVDDETKIQVEKLSKMLGIKEAELVRFFITEGLAQVTEQKSGRQIPDTVDLTLITTSIRLPSYVKDLAVVKSKSKGMRLGRWIASLVQSNVLGEPVVVGEEVSALRESSRYLLAIGRNINQIAKALNETFYETERVKIEMLNDLKKAIENTDDRIDQLIKTSQKAWSVN